MPKRLSPSDPINLDAILDVKVLISVAGRLIGDGVMLTSQEQAIIASNAVEVSDELVELVRAAILESGDPLGAAFCRIRTPKDRRQFGQTFTPQDAVIGMFQWAERRCERVSRIVDPGAGTGRYVLTGLRRHPAAIGVAVEADPLIVVLLRANARVLGLHDRLDIIVDDYRNIALPEHDGQTLFVGNPPYVRHHDISSDWKEWYSSTLKRLGHASSKLAGLHLHFFLKTLELAKEGDVGCFITAAEWLDVKYGQSLRDLLLNGLGGRAVFVVTPEVPVFDDALVSACITCFEPKSEAREIEFKRIDSTADLLQLEGGHLVQTERALAEVCWTRLLHNRERVRNADHILLGDVFRVSRGQVTGKNEVFVVKDNAFRLPDEFLVPAITGAKEIINAPAAKIDAQVPLLSVVQLPASLDEVPAKDRSAVAAFLRWARKNDAHKSYIAKARRPWWRVDMSATPPIVMTYMGRRPPVFALNTARAGLINVAHGLYPKVALDEQTLENLVTWLNCNITEESGRVYAGGLTKFEPSEVMRLEIPNLHDLQGRGRD